MMDRLIEKLKAEGVPYWATYGVLLINGDCLKVLPWIEARGNAQGHQAQRIV